ncbi:transposase [Caldalkalibacillus thermarum]|uniref:transposase n=1 Tax=Caldalkalibacillus thermarum TaxID=296745 RepID=UPI001FD3E7D3|nr:transposase [Caldalkalibacillus thermarum]
MAIIPQLSLFGWEEIEELGDLERLRLVMEAMPDEKLMQTLETERKQGRNDYPIRAMWNSILAGIVFQHESIEKLRRELARNGQLRHLCGFQGQVPSSWAYTRFFKKLLHHADLIQAMFDSLVQELRKLLPDFGKHLAIDSKAIPSYARHKTRNRTPDGRRDTEATYGVKTYRGVKEDGTPGRKSCAGSATNCISSSMPSMNCHPFQPHPSPRGGHHRSPPDDRPPGREPPRDVRARGDLGG